MLPTIYRIAIIGDMASSSPSSSTVVHTMPHIHRRSCSTRDSLQIIVSTLHPTWPRLKVHSSVEKNVAYICTE